MKLSEDVCNELKLVQAVGGLAGRCSILKVGQIDDVRTLMVIAVIPILIHSSLAFNVMLGGEHF